MARAIFEGTIIAESDQTEVVEGNYYFPLDSVKTEHVRKSDTTSNCPWKGIASYYHVVSGDKESKDAAWYYPEPKEAAARIKDHVAFWRDVTIEEG